MFDEPNRLSPSIEDYLKRIYALAERRAEGAPAVKLSELAARMGVTASSASGMLRRLAELDLVAHARYGGIELTPAGRARALAVVRRHRLVETFLVRELGYRWDEVHAEAEVLEHAVSDTLLARIAARLGDPDVDPHGDPIPTAAGEVAAPRARPLSALGPGESGRIERVDDTDPALLRHLADAGIGLGAPVQVLEHRPFGGPLVVRVGRGRRAAVHDFGSVLAAAVWVGAPVAGGR